MITTKNEQMDAVTKKAWEMNWEDISMDEILGIFNYHRVKKQMELFLRVLPKNDTILEGGCGLSPYLIKLRQLGYNVVGIDYNEAPLKKALSYDPDLPLKVGDVMAVPYPDNTFGGYISLGVIEHFTEGPQKAIREAHRVLKPGGVFVVFVPWKHIYMRLQAPILFLKGHPFLRKLFKKPETHYWQQYFKKKELSKLMENEGFEVRELHAIDHSHALLSSFGVFRDKNTLDEATPLGLKVAAWCEKHLYWPTAANMVLICYKKKAS